MTVRDITVMTVKGIVMAGTERLREHEDQEVQKQSGPFGPEHLHAVTSGGRI